jgi:hypothetical protein
MNQATIEAIKSWGQNTVRIPLNEDCWLSINGAAYNATMYQNTIKDFVDGIIATQGMHAILDLHWTAEGSTLATQQDPMPDYPTPLNSGVKLPQISSSKHATTISFTTHAITFSFSVQGTTKTLFLSCLMNHSPVKASPNKVTGNAGSLVLAMKVVVPPLKQRE